MEAAEFWKIIAGFAMFLLNVVIAVFGKKYFDRLDSKIDGIEDKLDNREKEHYETKEKLAMHELRITNLEKA